MFETKLQPFVQRYDEISALLVAPEILNDVEKITQLSKEQSGLEPIVAAIREYSQARKQIEENKLLFDDKELGELAKDENHTLEARVIALEQEIKILLLPKDPNDDKNIYLEIRAGTGGDEAGIFVGDLFKAYCRYAELKAWKVEIISSSENNVGG